MYHHSKKKKPERRRSEKGGMLLTSARSYVNVQTAMVVAIASVTVGLQLNGGMAAASLISSEAAAAAKTTGNNHHQHVQVCIVGNGPTGLAASSLLAGWWPYYSRSSSRHPDDRLHAALVRQLDRAAEKKDQSHADDVSLLELDLTEALKIVSEPNFPKRTHSPWAILADTLLHPGADGGPSSYPSAASSSTRGSCCAYHGQP